MNMQPPPAGAEATTWSIRTTLSWMTNRFKEVGSPTPLLDAQLLLVDVLKIQKIKLYTDLDRLLTDDERGVLRGLVKRRLSGEPLAYLTNQKVWHDLDLFVDKRVLIPRPETETMLDFVLGYLKDSRKTPGLIFDFCTGSGCLAIAFAKRFPNATVIAVDISQDALEVARLNAERNKVSNVQFLHADVTTAACFKALKEFGVPDVIVANPPYISHDEWMTLDIEVRDFEPKVSLVADGDGLSIATDLLNQIKANGWFESLMCFSMELRDGHPAAMQSNDLRALPFRSLLSELPKQDFFALRDLEDRARFLCWVAAAQVAEALPEEAAFDGTEEDESLSEHNAENPTFD